MPLKIASLSLVMALGLALAPATAKAGVCDEIRLLIPDDLSGDTEATCECPIEQQIRAELALTVPAGDVETLAALLVSDDGMFRMVWLCCGYEPASGRTGSIPIPNGVIAQGPRDSLTALSVSLFADGFKDGDTSNPMPLGALPARLIFRLMDI